MKLGILQCDSVLPEFQTKFGDYDTMLVDLFSLCDPTIEFEIYNVQIGEYPNDIHDCDAYVTTGSKASVYDELDWIPPLKSFIRVLAKKQKKLIAICFCHQLIAETFSGKTQASEKGWGVGVAENKILQKKPWMQPDLATLKLVVSHKDQVQILPENAELLASSEFCPYFMYQINNTILTVQGHPEFSHDYSETLMRHRKDIIGEPTFSNAIKSLDQISDEVKFTQWMLNFINLR